MLRFLFVLFFLFLGFLFLIGFFIFRLFFGGLFRFRSKQYSQSNSQTKQTSFSSQKKINLDVGEYVEYEEIKEE